jgi:hypothetical protein
MSLRYLLNADAATESTYKEYSMQEAYKLGITKAKEWNKNAELVIMSSVDDDGKQESGANGKRKKWNLIFADISSQQTILLLIDRGKSVKAAAHEEKILEEIIIPSSNIQMDSNDLIERVKTEFKLKPGMNWANGYHFSIMNNGKKTFVVVTGYTEDNCFTQIYFDSQTGEYINSRVNVN